ncbi:MAG: bestrophin family protein [Vicingaceae bacterium]
MIVYDSKKWNNLASTIFKTFRQAYNVRKLTLFMTVTLIYSVLMTYVNLTFFTGYFKIDTVFFTIIGVILSLFLVFRINTSYDRWWEGSITWHKLLSDSRTLAMSLDGLLPVNDTMRRNFFVKSISNYAIALQSHLRDEDALDHLIFVNRAYTKSLEQTDHLPNTIINLIYSEIHALGHADIITDRDKTQLKDHLRDMVDLMTSCERIHRTPIPFSHSTFIKIFALIYIFMLPFGLVNVFGWLTIPAVCVMAFAMFGVEIISEEIEHPFGTDANDLPTGYMSDMIRENVYEILKVKLDFKLEKRPRKEADVLL